MRKKRKVNFDIGIKQATHFNEYALNSVIIVEINAIKHAINLKSTVQWKIISQLKLFDWSFGFGCYKKAGEWEERNENKWSDSECNNVNNCAITSRWNGKKTTIQLSDTRSSYPIRIYWVHCLDATVHHEFIIVLRIYRLCCNTHTSHIMRKRPRISCQFTSRSCPIATSKTEKFTLILFSLIVPILLYIHTF